MTQSPAAHDPADTGGGAVCFERVVHADDGGGRPAPALLWRFARPVRAVSSAMLGGGIRDAAWVLNAQVRSDYGRLDPDEHLRQIATEHALDPRAGIGLLTAARVERVATATGRGVRCDATVGVSYPTWAAAPDDEALPADRWRPGAQWRPGTINLVCQVPVPMTDAALVGAVLTATEAKTQALLEAGVPGTGTASDAVVVCCPRDSDAGAPALPVAEPFAGPRSVWGARLARAVHRAVVMGLETYAQHD